MTDGTLRTTRPVQRVRAQLRAGQSERASIKRTLARMMAG